MLPNLNPDQIAAAYAFVCTLEPFNYWAREEKRKDFPHADSIEFHIVGDRAVWAWKKRKADGSYILACSDKAPGHVANLVMLMSHEMIHLYQDLNRIETAAMHNRDFNARAKVVCDIHGYDYRLFV